MRHGNIYIYEKTYDDTNDAQVMHLIVTMRHKMMRHGNIYIFDETWEHIYTRKDIR